MKNVSMKTKLCRTAVLMLLALSLSLGLLPPALSASAAEASGWAGGYNVNDAVSYALEYALGKNDDYIYLEEKDCCSFVSQCLRAGGLKDVYTGSCWYYAGGLCSSSWWNCSALLNFLQEQGVTILKDPAFSDIQAGDLVFYDLRWGEELPNGEMDHVTICTGRDVWGTPVICGHSSDRLQCNYNYAVAGSTYYVAQLAPRGAAQAQQAAPAVPSAAAAPAAPAAVPGATNWGLCVNGTRLSFSPGLQMANDRLMAPMWGFACNLGAQVFYIDSGTVNFWYNNKLIVFTAGTQTYSVGGEQRTALTTPATVNGSLYVGVRDLADAMGLGITADGAACTVNLTK